MKIRLVFVSLVLGSALVNAANSDSSNEISVVEKKTITASVEKLSKIIDKKLPVTSIAKSPITGLVQLTSDLNIFYISADGRYMIFGDMIDLSKDRSSWSITESEVRKLRLHALSAIKQKDMIIFPATGNTLATITVFTDLDCKYCQKMQENINEYNDAGITVRYLAFPRTGPKSASFDEAIKVWCAKDKKSAFNAAINKREFSTAKCSKNPVMMEYELGRKMGISGTPTIILENGAKVPGLIDAKTLVEIINKN